MQGISGGGRGGHGDFSDHRLQAQPVTCSQSNSVVAAAPLVSWVRPTCLPAYPGNWLFSTHGTLTHGRVGGTPLLSLFVAASPESGLGPPVKVLTPPQLSSPRPPSIPSTSPPPLRGLRPSPPHPHPPPRPPASARSAAHL